MRPKPFRLAGFCAAALLSGALAVTHVAPAHAQGTPAAADAKKNKKDAVAAFKAGQKKLKANDFEGALADFRTADKLFPGANPKYQIALCLDKLNKSAEAVAAYRGFIALNPVATAKKEKTKKRYAGFVAEATKRITALAATLPATVTLAITPDSPPGLAITVNNQPVSGTSLSLPAGTHTIVVTAEGFQDHPLQVIVKAGEKKELAVALTLAAAPPPPLPPPPPPPPPPVETTRSNVPAYVTLGIAGAGAILGTVFGIQALGAKSDFEAAPSLENADKAERAALIADMSFGVALTFGITGAVLLFSGDDEPAEGSTTSALPTLVPLAGPKGGGMSATWTF